jgi:phosphatidylinositol 4-kinase
MQVGAEIKLLTAFMKTIHDDQIRGDHSTSSMSDRSPAFLIRASVSINDYSAQHRDRVRILQLLLENEIARLNVWWNPVNESGRGSGSVGKYERSISTVR